MRKLRSAVVAAVALAVSVTACAGPTETTATQTSTTGQGDATQDGGMSEETTSPAASQDIVATASAAGDFTTLVTAVKAAGLEETLQGPGPFTVFAPTDAAFAKLPAGTLDTLLADPKGGLAGILKYHVVAGEVPSSQVLTMNGQKVATVNGAELTINVNGEKVSLTDAKGNTVNVTSTDVEASNGVIHVIDGVLMP